MLSAEYWLQVEHRPGVDIAIGTTMVPTAVVGTSFAPGTAGYAVKAAFGRAAILAARGTRLRQSATVAAAVGQILLPTFAGPRFEPGEEPPNVISPAPYTFAVWFPIFGTSLRYAIRSARAPADQQLPPRIGWPLAGAFASTAVWAPLVRTGRYWSAQIALAGIAGCGELARRRLADAEPLPRRDSTASAAVIPASMLAAWGATATGVNLNAMVAAQHRLSARQQQTAAVVTLLALGLGGGAATTAGGGAGTLGARVYAGTLVWGLAGVVVGQRQRFAAGAVAAALASVPALRVVLKTAGSDR